MKLNSLIISILLFNISAFSQESISKIDSLLNVIRNSDNDSISALSHSDLVLLYLRKDTDLAKAHNDSAYTLYNKLSDQNGLASANHKYGIIYRFTGDYKKAMGYINKSMSYYKSKNDTFKIASVLFQKGVINSIQGNYEESLKDFYEILSIYESTNDSTMIGVTANSIGITYKDLKKYPESIESFKRAIRIHERLGDNSNLPNAYSNLGTVFMDQKKFQEALEYLGKARKINMETENTWGMSINNQNIGLILIELGKYSESLPYLNDAYEIQKKNDYKNEVVATLSKLGYVYLQLGEYQKSEELLLKGLKNGTNSKITNQELHSTLSKLYDKTNDFKKAFFHYNKSVVFKDSIFEEENMNNINALQVQFQSEKKDKEIIEKELQIQQKENQLQKKQIQNGYISGVAIFLLITSLLGWFLYRQRQKRKDQEILALKRNEQVKTLESLMLGEEKERIRIARELHDGLNGDLSAVKYKITALLEKNTNEINEVVAMIDKSCEQVRAISHNLVPPSLEKYSLTEALEDYCSKMNEINAPEIIFQFIGEEIRISKKNEVHIYRIIQELVSNALKHADASEIAVQLSHHHDRIQLTVEDNGKGFDINKVTGDGIGLKNVSSRVDYLNAEIDFSSDNKGTSHTIEIDINKLNDY